MPCRLHMRPPCSGIRKPSRRRPCRPVSASGPQPTCLGRGVEAQARATPAASALPAVPPWWRQWERWPRCQWRHLKRRCPEPNCPAHWSQWCCDIFFLKKVSRRSHFSGDEADIKNDIGYFPNKMVNAAIRTSYLVTWCFQFLKTFHSHRIRRSSATINFECSFFKVVENKRINFTP